MAVDVQFQKWGNHLQKFDATLAGGNAPDVIEMGNTEMAKYMVAGAFQDLTSDRRLVRELEHLARRTRGPGPIGRQGRTASRTTRGRGSSRTGPTSSRRPAIKVPTSLAEFTAAARKLAGSRATAASRRSTSPGTDWYFAMGFVYDYGGSIAKLVSGKWKGTLTSPRSIAGLTAYKNFFLAASRASKTTDETHPNPYDVYAQGNAGLDGRPRLVHLLRRRQVQGHRPRSS